MPRRIGLRKPRKAMVMTGTPTVTSAGRRVGAEEPHGDDGRDRRTDQTISRRFLLRQWLLESPDAHCGVASSR